ncbi:MAG: PF20097 family protein [Chloroflexales bacterium]|nr:PF20097 family protein [Chloroflexales bacterium]
MKCPKCETEMIEGALSLWSRMITVVKKGDLFAERTGVGAMLRGSTITPFFCPSCQYVEFYLDNPNHLINNHNNHNTPEQTDCS